MISQSNGNDSSSSQPMMVILTVLAAIVILIVGGLLYRFVINPPTPTSTAEVEGGEAATEGWPSPPATFTPASSPPPASPPSPTPTPTPLPPPYWERLGYLTSIEFEGTIIIEREREKTGIGGIFGTDRVLLMVVGRIQAGVDLAQIQSSDFEIDGSSLRIVLPHAMVTSVELLPGDSRIYDSQQSWVFSEYEGLETEALEEARRRLRENTQNNEGMMSLAETLARLQLSDFLRNAGFTEIEIVFE